MANIKDYIKKIQDGTVSLEEQQQALAQVEQTIVAERQKREEAIGKNVDMVIAALRTIEDRLNAKYQELLNTPAMVGEQGPQGIAGRDGKDGLNGRDGRDGKDGVDGVDGQDGKDGISVIDAQIDFDGSLLIKLSDGSEIDAGMILPPDTAKLVHAVSTNGGGTSQSVLDALASLQAQIDGLSGASIPSQTGNAGKFLTTNGTTTSWATVSSGGGSGTVTSVSATGGTGISITGSPITTSGTLTITNTAPDQTVSITGGGGAVVTGTYPNFTVTTPSGTVTNVTATSPLFSTGGATPNLTVQKSDATHDGYLSSTDWSTFNGKQDTLVSGTNIKTINSTSVLGSGDIAVQPTLVSATNIKTINGASILGSGDLTVSGSFTGGTLTSNLTLAANSTSLQPLKFQSGTLNTTAGAGVMEYDGTAFYSSIAASTRGVMPSEQLVILNSTYTLTSQTAAQKLFNASTNGAVTLPIGTHYFECFFSLSGMSATSGSFGFSLVPGTAVIGSQGWWAMGEKGTATVSTATTAQSSYNTAAATTLATASTNTVGYAHISGYFKVTTAGTVTPSVSLTVASAAVVGINSYFRTYPVSPTAAANITVGNWS